MNGIDLDSINVSEVLGNPLSGVDSRLVVALLDQRHRDSPRRIAILCESPDDPLADPKPFEDAGVAGPSFVIDSKGNILTKKSGRSGGGGPFYSSFFITLPARLGGAACRGDDGKAGAAIVALLAELADARKWLLHLAPSLRPQIDFSVPEVDASLGDLPFNVPPFDGRGVVLGVVDYGLDIAHPNFRLPDGRTRILSLWDHNEAGPGPAGLSLKGAPPPASYPYGREFTRAQINDALASPNPYWALGYDPNAHYYQPGPVAGAHGTNVTDIAAGNGSASRAAGVAPGADIMFVQITPDALKHSLGSLTGGEVFNAVSYIFDNAKRRGQPAVVNLSLSTNSGPHDGSNVLEKAFDALLKQDGRAIVIAAGNFAESGLHASGSVLHDSPRRMVWRFVEGDVTPNELEIWYETGNTGDIVVCTLIAPDGTRLGPIGPVQPYQPYQVVRDGKVVGHAMRGFRPGSKAGTTLQQIYFRLEPSGKEEDWAIELDLGTLALPQVDFDAWIERDDKGGTTQSSFGEHDIDPARSLGSLSCGNATIVVGAYYEIVEGRPIAFFSSWGPTRDGRKKPDVSAPGYQILAARSKGYQPIPGSRFHTSSRIAMSGTSQSAPHVAGLAALLLQKNPAATSTEVADAIRTFSRPPPDFPVPPHPPDHWHPRYGFGTIDVAMTVAEF